MHEVVYKVSSQEEQLRVMTALEDAGLEPIIRQDWTADPTLQQVSGFTATIPIAVPADQAEAARRVLAEVNRPRDQDVQEIHSGCMSAIFGGVAGAAGAFLLFWSLTGHAGIGVAVAVPVGIGVAIMVGVRNGVLERERPPEDDEYADF